MVKREEKEDFLRLFLQNYQMRKREANWILNYFLPHSELLDKLVFVSEGAEYCPLGLIISTECATGTPYLSLYQSGDMTIDPDRIFNRVKTSDKPIYLELHFKDENTGKHFDVIEDNPYLPKETKFAHKVDDIIFALQWKIEVENLLMEIDKALDNRDKDAFLRLSAEYKEMVGVSLVLEC